MKIKMLALAGLIAGASAPAYAQWLYQAEQSAFGDDGVHMAMTGSGNYGFGIRCQNGELAAILLTPEDIKAEDAAAFAYVSTYLLLRIDDNPPHKIGTDIDTVDGKLRAWATVDRPIAVEISEARRRVAVAIEFGDSRYHEQTYGVRGSTNSMNKLISNCAGE